MKRVLFLAAGLAALHLSGCSVVIGGSVNDSCEADADCAELGFANATCDTENNVCVPAGDQCETADDCEARNGGKQSICRADKTCVQLLTEDCSEVYGNYKDPNAIVLGFLGPLTGSDASTGVPIADGTKLALNEFAKNAVGLPGGPDGAVRPLAMVYCHDLGGPESDPWRAAKHLVNDVRVPAIVGPAFSGVTISTAQTVTIPAGVLTISASATSPSITKLNDKDLVWRTCPSDAVQAIPLAGLLGPLETEIRAAQGLEPSDQIRVAMTVKGDAYGSGLADAVEPLLQFNGKNFTQNGDNYIRLPYSDPTEGAVDYSVVIAPLTTDFFPHVVLVLGTTEGVTEVFTQIEAQWPTSGTPPPRPYYLFPDGGKVVELLSAIGAKDDLRRRVRGTVPGDLTTQLYSQFRSRYKGFFKQKEPLAFADTGYDALYLLAYSMVAIGDKEITGANIAGGLKKMSKGTTFDVAPGEINSVIQALQASGEIDYNGASGPLNFDPNTGEAKANIDIWCVIYDGDDKPIFKSSGQKYDAAQGKVVGTYTCE